MTGTDVGGRVINLAVLEQELITAGVQSNGLTIQGPNIEAPPLPPLTNDPTLPAGSKLFTHAADGTLIDFPAADQATVDRVMSDHVAMRDKSDAEYAAEYQDSATTAQRRQQINAIMTGLLPREQVPM